MSGPLMSFERSGSRFYSPLTDVETAAATSLLLGYGMRIAANAIASTPIAKIELTTAFVLSHLSNLR